MCVITMAARSHLTHAGPISLGSLSAYGWAETILRHSPDDLASVHAPDLAKLLLGGLADDDAVGQVKK